MERLVVLSEIDSLKFLNKSDIYPDEFYTDFELFKNRASSFHEAHIIVLFIGSCRFSKRHVGDLIKILRARADNENDKGVLSLTILSDGFLPLIDKYYRYDGTFDSISQNKGWKVKVKDSDIMSKIYKGNKNNRCKKFLNQHDEGYVEDLREHYKSESSTEEPLRDLIKKPIFE